MSQNTTLTTAERRTLTVEEAAAQLGVSRNHGYLLARTGELPTIRMGKRWLVPAAALNRLLEGKTAA